MIVSLVKGLIMLISGIIFIFAGIYGWKFPTIQWYWRQRKYGEDLNSIIMIMSGVIIIILSVWFMLINFGVHL